MWALTVIVQDKLLYRAPKVRLAEWDNPTDTIRLDTQDEPFGMRIQIWGTRRKAEWGHTTFNKHLSEGIGVERVAVEDEMCLIEEKSINGIRQIP